MSGLDALDKAVGLVVGWGGWWGGCGGCRGGRTDHDLSTSGLDKPTQPRVLSAPPSTHIWPWPWPWSRCSPCLVGCLLVGCCCGSKEEVVCVMPCGSGRQASTRKCALGRQPLRDCVDKRPYLCVGTEGGGWVSSGRWGWAVSVWKIFLVILKARQIGHHAPKAQPKPAPLPHPYPSTPPHSHPRRVHDHLVPPREPWRSRRRAHPQQPPLPLPRLPALCSRRLLLRRPPRPPTESWTPAARRRAPWLNQRRGG